MLPSKKALEKIYEDADSAVFRFKKLSENFKKAFNSEQMEFFTSPGRAEIIGNHTDHNGGKVIAGSISLDTIGAAFPSQDDTIQIISERFDEVVKFKISEIDKVPKRHGSLSLVAGMVKSIKDLGYKVNGFNLFTSSTVIAGAGLSSSASFEMLVCSVINYFFNENTLDIIQCAKIGQKAENEYWCKASGLMDQVACSVGGAIKLDFNGDVKYEKINLDFDKLNYSIIIVNTGKGHADLSSEYSSIPFEMKSVAKKLGYDLLCETSLEELVKKTPELIKLLKNDRALLRAYHFYNENQRVEEMGKLLESETANIKEIIKLIDESGRSSFEFLQNCYVDSQPNEQKISLCLALSLQFIKKIGKGVCRVHGGGFAGAIMTILPKEAVSDYVKFMERFVGKENVYLMNIRKTGTVHIS